MTTAKEPRILRQIDKVKGELAALGDLRPGTLSTQYNVCGTPGCRCKASPPKKHGPYYQVSFTRKGKSSTKFVRKEDLPAVRRQLKNYEAMKRLVDRWVDLAIELSNLRLTKDRAWDFHIPTATTTTNGIILPLIDREKLSKQAEPAHPTTTHSEVCISGSVFIFWLFRLFI